MTIPNFMKLGMLLALTCESGALTVPPKILCGDLICQAGTNCKIGNGQPTCVGVSEANCEVFGFPPYFKTFDGKTFNFQGPCTYTLAETSHNDTNLPGFSIKIAYQNQGNTKIMNPTFEITDPSQNTTLKTKNNKLTKVNQNLEKRAKISSSGLLVIIKTDFGLILRWDKKNYMKLTIPNIFNQKVRGLCGNSNGNSADDFETPTGTRVARGADFGRSWVVDDGQCIEPPALTVPPKILCGDVICQAGTKCQIGNGQPTCVEVSEANCQVSGFPPYFKTFDGKFFGFQAPCTYTLAETYHNDTNLPGFRIKIAYQNEDNTKIINPTLEITDPSQNKKTKNNKLTKVNDEILKKRAKISSFEHFVIIKIDFGLILEWDKKNFIKLTIPIAFNQKVRGLCGNSNGNSADDFETPTGVQAASEADFGRSWAVDDGQCNDRLQN